MKRILAVMALLATVGAPALAAYPERPVRIIIGFPRAGRSTPLRG